MRLESFRNLPSLRVCTTRAERDTNRNLSQASFSADVNKGCRSARTLSTMRLITGSTETLNEVESSSKLACSGYPIVCGWQWNRMVHLQRRQEHRRKKGRQSIGGSNRLFRRRSRSIEATSAEDLGIRWVHSFPLDAILGSMWGAMLDAGIDSGRRTEWRRGGALGISTGNVLCDHCDKMSYAKCPVFRGLSIGRRVGSRTRHLVECRLSGLCRLKKMQAIGVVLECALLSLWMWTLDVDCVRIF